MEKETLSNEKLDKLRKSGIKIRLMTEEESARVATITKNSYYKPKYRKALRTVTRMDVHDYFNKHPEATAKEVLADMIASYNPHLPSPLLLEMTEFILSEWETLQAEKKELVLV
jgi:hypothetical protein